jgi:hypothetical protein
VAQAGWLIFTLGCLCLAVGLFVGYILGRRHTYPSGMYPAVEAMYKRQLQDATNMRVQIEQLKQEKQQLQQTIEEAIKQLKCN